MKYLKKLVTNTRGVISLVIALALITTSAATTVNAAVCDDGNTACYNQQGFLYYDPADTSCSSSSGDTEVTSINGKSNVEKIYNFLLTKGFSPEQAAGILGNIQVESGFSATRQEGDKTFPDGGWGLVQWTGGRRDSLISYLNTKLPNLVQKYYQNQYGGPTQSSNGYIADGVPETDSDQLLLAELNYMYRETKNHVINSTTASKGSTYGKAGDNELQTIKQQTTVKGASDIWVYNYEVPADIDATAIVRAENGAKLFSSLTGLKGSSGCNSDYSGLSGSIRNKVLQVAKSELNLWNSGKLKAGHDFTKYTGGIETEWCAYFASWVYKTAGYPITDSDGNTAIPTVSQIRSIGELGKSFQWHSVDSNYTPVPGDLAIYAEHVNLVVTATGPRDYTTIGGNEGSETQTFNEHVVKANSGYWPPRALGFVSPKGEQ